MNIYKYRVCGNCKFPIDMLRYDSCWPSTSADAFVIALQFELPQQPQQIGITGIQPPTVARWESLGWRLLTKVTSRRVPQPD
jgi:hypothetical protein